MKTSPLQLLKEETSGIFIGLIHWGFLPAWAKLSDIPILRHDEMYCFVLTYRQLRKNLIRSNAIKSYAIGGVKAASGCIGQPLRQPYRSDKSFCNGKRWQADLLSSNLSLVPAFLLLNCSNQGYHVSVESSFHPESDVLSKQSNWTNDIAELLRKYNLLHTYKSHLFNFKTPISAKKSSRPEFLYLIQYWGSLVLGVLYQDIMELLTCSSLRQFP